MKIWWMLVGVTLAVGCKSGGAAVGSTCSSDDDCADGLFCGKDAWSKGLCTQACETVTDCGPAGAFACPMGSCVPKCLLPSDCETNRCTGSAVCATGKTTSYDRCASAADCPSGMLCDKIADLAYRFCTQRCKTADDCPAAGSCDIADTGLCW